MDGAFWLMIAAVGTALMAFLSVVVWLGNRQEERKAHFRSEIAQRISEASDSGPILDYIRDNERADAAQTRLKARVAGLINFAVGVALMIFLYQAMKGTAAYLVGLIPLLVGVVLLMFSELMSKPAN